MRIKCTKLTNVRSHINSSYDFDNEVIFIGPNGSGKTTVLESIYFLLAGRGFKKQPLSGAVNFNEKFLRIESEIENKDTVDHCVLKYDGERKFYKNDTLIESISDYLYNNPVAVFSPDFLGVLSLSHSDRRAFIDRFIFYTSKKYIDNIRLYNRYISQKALIYKEESLDMTYLAILNENIDKLSEDISGKRYDMVSIINVKLNEIYSNIGFNLDKILLSYSTNTNKKDIFEREIESRVTQFGIHRDKIEMTLNGERIEKFSSFGQKKTFVLLCLFAVLKHVEEIRNFGIITLLDDFEAGLDKKRAGIMKELFSKGRQVFYSGVESLRLEFKQTINL